MLHERRMKGPDGRGLKKEEEKMRLITSYELSRKSKKELAALFAGVSKGLVLTNKESPERRNSLATLENINRAVSCCDFSR